MAVRDHLQKNLRAVFGIALLLLFCRATAAQDAPQLPPRPAPTVHIDSTTLPILDATPKFNVERAVDGYLAQVGGTARARSNAYFEGGYWLELIDLLYRLVVAGILLGLGVSVYWRDWAGERTHSRTGQVMIYVAGYVVITTLLTLPLSIYEDFVREHTYGLSNQSFLDWAGDFGISFALTFAASLVLLPILYAFMRATRSGWWLWGAALAILFLIFQLAAAPVFIEPLFNHYASLPESPLKQEILSLARANQVPAATIYVVDASRQSNRISANVSGFLGTTRIALTDNLLREGTHDEILAVVGHEMGHYVMDHATRLILLFGIVIVFGFAFLNWGFRLVAGLFGGTWQVREVDDVAGLPLLAALASLYIFAITPITNSITRTVENQADIFGLDAVRKPDAFATIILKLSSYRKLDPGQLEEIFFYDHPSGRTRIETAMRWKKEHISDTDIRDSVSPQ